MLYDRHRAILGWWPIGGAKANNDPRTASLAAVVKHSLDSGYEGIELSLDDMKATFFSQSTPDSVIIAEAKRTAPAGFFTGGTCSMGAIKAICMPPCLLCMVHH